jgi:MerR family transcriptional regulator, mercuric resistance operon regulatory protein
MTTYRIGEVADITGVSIDALRYYERRGLIKTPQRTDGGFRRYSTDALHRVSFIKQAQGLGLTLDDIQELLREHRSQSACERVHALLLKRIGDVDARIKELRELRTTLEIHRQSCERALDCGDHTGCPTLHDLEGTRETH